jgi:hypothetical protein
MMEIEYEPRFLEEAVLRAAGERPEGRLYRRERERLYAIADAEARGAAFDALNVSWFTRFGLDRPLARAFAEQPLVTAGVTRCAVGRPPRRRDAGADLMVRPGARLLRLLLAPELLLAGDELLAFLRRELQHVADMVDPRFGYAPSLPPVPGGPAYDRLLRERYRVVWDVTVDGRLVRAGHLPPTARRARRQEFLDTFGAFAEAELEFERLFADRAPTHAAITAFVLATAAGARAGGACALCGFPTSDLEPDPAALAAEVGAEIVADCPGWQPAAGCCRQCADLYRARAMSRAAAAALPGVR